MTPAQSRNAAMHADHRAWLEEDALWRDELRLWSNETHQLGPQIDRIKQALNLHAARLDAFGASLCHCEDSTHAHEHVLALKAQNRMPLDCQASAAMHRFEGEQQEDRRAHYEQLRYEHDRIVTLVRLLARALTGDRAQAGSGSG